MDKKLENALRNRWAEWLKDRLLECGEDPQKTAAGSWYVPTLDDNNDDAWVELKAIVHPGANEADGTDGYSLAKQYGDKQTKKKEKTTKKKGSEKNAD